MGEVTKIQWTDHTFNPWWGCTAVTEACRNCYAEATAKRYGHKLWGKSADRRELSDAHWREPIKWNAAAAADGVRKRVFCASMADVLEDRRDLDGHRERLFTIIEATPHLDWLLLSKRPQLFDKLTPWDRAWPANVWAGTSIAENRDMPMVGALLEHAAGAAVRFVSYEPAIERVDFARYLGPCGFGGVNVNWLIIGGESGARARPFDLEWARQSIERCRDTGAAPFFKQAGCKPMIGGVPIRLNDHKGGDPQEWARDLRVREWPTPQLRAA